MNFKIIAIIVVLVVGVIGIGVLKDDSNGDTSPDSTIASNSQGVSEANIVLTEAADFECPACASFYPIINEVKEEYKDRVVFEFVHLPLTAIHPNAFAAHRAAQAAAAQGKFWEMHDILFEQRATWVSTSTSEPVEQLENLAEQLGLDIAQFRLDFSSSAVNDFIQADATKARDMGATATPSFFLNGELLDNSAVASPDGLSALLDQKLAEANGETVEDQSQEEPAVEPES